MGSGEWGVEVGICRTHVPVPRPACSPPTVTATTADPMPITRAACPALTALTAGLAVQMILRPRLRLGPRPRFAHVATPATTPMTSIATTAAQMPITRRAHWVPTATTAVLVATRPSSLQVFRRNRHRHRRHRSRLRLRLPPLGIRFPLVLRMRYPRGGLPRRVNRIAGRAGPGRHLQEVRPSPFPDLAVA